jgi:hypothetical protein
MKKFLSVAMCLALGLSVAGCGMQGATEEAMETPTVDVEVGGEAVEVVLPAETVEAIDAAVNAEAEMPMPMPEEMPMPTEMPMEEVMAE